MVSRMVNLFPYWKSKAEELGFKDVCFTDREKDGLNTVIRNFKPCILLMDCVFYRQSTPYMMKVLLDEFPNLNIAAVNMHDYSDELAMSFIVNGVNSYVNKPDGMEEFMRGMKTVREGKKYISKSVQERIDMRDEYPLPANILTKRQNEVVLLICCGYREDEIAGNMHISKRTVNNHKLEIYRSLNVRNTIELFNAAHNIGLYDFTENVAAPKDFTVTPQPSKINKEQLTMKNEQGAMKKE